MISCSAPTLPLLTTRPSAENTSSVVGYRPMFACGIFDPSVNLPTAGLPFGRARSMCRDPSSDVCATVAVALAGSTTSLFSANFTAA